jgi:uncharacterized membrane protein YphA (DoxX/SURF4 family)
VVTILRWTTALLLIGHGGFGAFEHKPLLAEHYGSVGLPGTLVPVVGWFEILLGIAVLFRPAAPLLLFIMTWKVATELLYPISGAPIWEFIERGGSYAAPLALYLLLTARTRERCEKKPHGVAGRNKLSSYTLAGVES